MNMVPWVVQIWQVAVVHQQKATICLECTVIEKNVRTALPDEIIDAYNIEYFDTMTKFIKEGVEANTFTKENGQKQFEASESQEIRLTLFKSFL